MKKSFCLLLMLALLISCHSTRQTAGGKSPSTQQAGMTERDGSSFDKAIIIMETNEMTGIGAEYAWLKEHYPGYKSAGQYLLYNNKTPYDKIKIHTADGEEKEIYFDISHFFGK